MQPVRIDLAHEADFALGPLLVRPSIKEIERSGEREVIEPRVMQVLVALSKADGAVLSREDLINSCWDGRVVGEDAINRVVSRLRRMETGTADGVFRVETVTKVGFRLQRINDDSPDEAPLPLMGEGKAGLDRRGVIAAAGVIAASGGLAAWWAHGPALPAALADMMDKASSALAYSTPEQNEAAVAILREAVRQFPDRPEPWGVLATAYRQQGLNGRGPRSIVAMESAQSAAQRAVDLDPANVDGQVVLKVGKGMWWVSYEAYDRITGGVLRDFPDHAVAIRARASFLYETGQVARAISVGEKLVDRALPLPSTAAQSMRLWSAGRSEEAEALLQTLIDRWPRHFSVWSTRLKFLLFSDKVELAHAMMAHRPAGLDPIDIELWAAQIRAVESGDATMIATALSMFDKLVGDIALKAQEAITFSAFVSRPDLTFRYMDLYYREAEYNRSFRRAQAPERLFPHSGSLTFFLFEPPLERVRADQRFNDLAEWLGLANYWNSSGNQPDFARVVAKAV